MRAPFFGNLDRRTITKVAAILAAGGVAVLPTDTIYGFHCAASRDEAIERIRRLKGRREEAGFIHLAADCAMAKRLVARWPGDSKRLLDAIWPARLTAILPARGGDGRVAAGRGRGSVAVRVPARRELRALIEALGEPIVSTSVNRSGYAPLTRIREIAEAFPGLEAYVSQRGRPFSRPSTVVDFRLYPPRIVRAGAFRWGLQRRGFHDRDVARPPRAE